MTWKEYVEKAQDFAVYPASFMGIPVSKMVYPLIGLSGEIGEFMEKVKKIYRDGVSDELLKGLIKEAGDICWYTARLCYLQRIELEISRQCTILEPASAILSLTLSLPSLGITQKKEEYEELLNSIDKILGLLTQSNIKNAWENNLVKLTDREKRGVINGSGDNR